MCHAHDAYARHMGWHCISCQYVNTGSRTHKPLWSCWSGASLCTLVILITNFSTKCKFLVTCGKYSRKQEQKWVLGVNADNDTTKADGEQSEPAQAETHDPPQDRKTSSKAGNKGSKDSTQEDKAKKTERTSDKGKKNDKGRRKGKKRDVDDLRSKLPPDLQGKILDMSDMKDMDMDSLTAKIEAMKLEKQGDLCLFCMQFGLSCCVCQNVLCFAYVV